MNIQVWRRFILLGLVLICFPVAGQHPCNFGPMEEDINRLIKSHDSSMEDKKFIEFERFYVKSSENYSISRKDQPFIFSYGPGRTFRFYVLTSGKDVQLTLMQDAKGDLRNHPESKVLFQTVQESSNPGVKYYDYSVKEEDDFQLSLTSHDTSPGCAVMVFVVIAPENPSPVKVGKRQIRRL